MKKVYSSLFFFLSITAALHAADGFAGSDQMSSPNQPAVIGPNPSADDAQYNYTWSRLMQDSKGKWIFDPVADPELIGKRKNPQITIRPSKTSKYRLVRCVKGTQTLETPPEPDDVTVYVFAIDYFRFNANKPWKVVVGSDIEFGATAIPGCTNWEWKLGTATTWDKWSLAYANQQQTALKIPYTDLSKAHQDQNAESWFGETFGIVTVSCKDPYGKTHIVNSLQSSTPQRVKVFFDPFLDINGGGEAGLSPINPPCWFLFWQKEKAVDGLNFCSYRHSKAGAAAGTVIDIVGEYNPYNGLIALYAPAGKNNSNSIAMDTSGPLHLTHQVTKQVITVGGSANRIDFLAEVIAHEMYHRYVHVNRHKAGASTDSDLLFDADETDPTANGDPAYRDGSGNSIFPKSDILLPDTYNLSTLCPEFAEYASYGDQEVRCRIVETKRPMTIYRAKDWSTDDINMDSNWKK